MIWSSGTGKKEEYLIYSLLCVLSCAYRSLVNYFIHAGNIVFCLVHYIHAFNYLEGFFINVYFGVIVYYVGFKLLQAMHVRSYGFWILHGLFGLTIVFDISVLVEKFLNDYKNCQGTLIPKYRIMVSDCQWIRHYIVSGPDCRRGHLHPETKIKIIRD